jgi:replicative DNA helicase
MSGAQVVPLPTADGGPSPMFSREAEMSVLGAMLIDPERIGDVLELLQEGDFYREAHRRMFRAIAAEWQERGEMEPVGLAERLRAAGDFDAVGGIGYISELWDYAVTAANLEYHATIVQRHAARRRMVEQANAVTLYVQDNPLATTEELQAAAERLIGDASPARAGDRNPGFVDVRVLLRGEMERMEAIGPPSWTPASTRST